MKPRSLPRFSSGETDLVRYERLGFTGNPFRVLEGEDLLRSFVPRPEFEMDQCLRAQCIQILGDRGHGKTLHIRALLSEAEKHAETTAYRHLEPGQKGFEAPDSQVDLLAIDELQRLGRKGWDDLLKYARDSHCRLALTSHEDFTVVLLAAGYKPVTLHFGSATPEWIKTWCRHRIKQSIQSETSNDWNLTDDAARSLIRQHAGDIYASELHLYEVFDKLSRSGNRKPGDITVADLAR